jgi:hypothetical protein
MFIHPQNLPDLFFCEPPLVADPTGLRIEPTEHPVSEVVGRDAEHLTDVSGGVKVFDG